MYQPFELHRGMVKIMTHIAMYINFVTHLYIQRDLLNFGKRIGEETVFSVEIKEIRNE